MRRFPKSAHVFALAASLPAVLARAENWPQWRGPFLNGSTTETGLPAAWSETENVAWVAALPGPGAATPIVWEDKVFVSSEDEATKSLVALCLDARSGRVLWQRTAGRTRKARSNTMAAPSPATDGKVVYFAYGTGVLVAFDFGGRQLWARELERDYGEFVLQYGHSSSPLLYDGKLYILVMQNKNPSQYKPSKRKGPLDSFLLAIDPRTGRDLWRHVRPTDATGESPESYTTPVPYEGAGRREIILVGGEYVTGHDARGGRELWRWEFVPHDRKIWQRTVASAVAGDGLIYAIRPRHRPLFALKGGGKGRLGGDRVAWSFKKYTSDVATPLLYRNRLYVLHDAKKTIACLDPGTGEVKWDGKLGVKGVIRASPTGGDGKIYVISEKGEAVVLAAGDEFRVLHRAEMGGRPCRSTIAVSGGRLFIRTADKLYCIRR